MTALRPRAAAAKAPVRRAPPAAKAVILPWYRKFTAMQWSMGFSIAVHVALVLLRFGSPATFDRIFKEQPLDVILVNAKTSDDPTKAQVIAQASLAGGGDMAEGRSTSPLPNSAETEVGFSEEEAERKIERLVEEQRNLLAQVKNELAQMPVPEVEVEAATEEERQQEEKRRQKLKLLAEIEKRVNEESARPKRRYVSPATKQAAYAMYYDAMRRKIEERGTRNFPQHAGKKLYGELVMDITVNEKGEVLETEIVQSSGDRKLDHRAIAIVNASAPYGDFTAEMKAKADLIVMTSLFRFTREETLEATAGVRQ